MKISNPLKTRYFWAVFGAVLAFTGAQSVLASASRPPQTALTRISAADWQKLMTAESVAHGKVNWRILITEVSYFGGFYVKGHLIGSKDARVHLIWPPEQTPSGVARSRLEAGKECTVAGDFEGVTQEHEALISVRKCLP
jgi:hypothetical protein